MTRSEYYEELKQLARRVRTEHGLTTAKVTLTDMRRIYKTYDLKVKLWHQPLKKVRGAFVQDELGAEVMVNARLPKEQRIFTMAHELKHFLVDKVSSSWSEGNESDPVEIGAEVFAAELIYPERMFADDLAAAGVTASNFTAQSIVKLKRSSETTLSFTSLGKRAEFLGFAARGSLAKVQWKKLEEQLFGEPTYKRIQRYRAARASRNYGGARLTE